MTKKFIKYSELLKFVSAILTKVGLDRFSNDCVAKGLCEASLRGVDSHGIRLLDHYVNSAIYGRKNPRPKFKFKKKYPALGILDANNAFGHAAGIKAIKYCIKMANKYGVGIVAVKNSSHPGALASIVLEAARKNYICWGFTHADSLLLSHGGKRAFFGTNPICFAAPRKNEEPFCLDMATSKISWNKLLSFKDNKLNLKNDLAADQYGNSTILTTKAKTLMPVGDYKGYGLASMIEILCGVFTGMNFGRSIKAMYTTSIREKRKLGQFYIVMKADGVLSTNFFLKRMFNFSKEVRNEPAKKNKKVLLPNDPEISTSKLRKRKGIPLDKKVFKDFKNLSEKYSIKLNFIK